MNDFSKEELDVLNTALSLYETRIYGSENTTKFSPLLKKIGMMSDNYWPEDNIKIIGSGYLLFHNTLSASALLAEINKHVKLCDNTDESKCFALQWRILYGPKFGY